MRRRYTTNRTGQTGTVDVAEALGTYLEIVDSCAPGLVEGLYVVGSFALGDWHPDRSDIDIVAITAEPATDDDAGALRTAHALLAEHQPHPFVDGPYLAWGDLITPPMGLHRPWTLEGRLHHDGDCFELNPVTWYVLATHGVTVRGPSVDRLGVYVDVDARVRFVVDNLRTYWRSVATDVRTACRATPDRSFHPDSFEWCALGALRLHHTAFHGSVISKLDAGEHGLQAAPAELHPTLQMALDVRSGRSSVAAVSAGEMELTADVIDWCVAQVVAAARR